jgi:hypothetical protein
MKTWYVSEAENSKGNYLQIVKDKVSGLTHRLIVSKNAIGDLDISDPKAVTTLDKFVTANKGVTILNEDGSYRTLFGFGAGTRKYAATESKLKAFDFAKADNDLLEVSANETELD